MAATISRHHACPMTSYCQPDERSYAETGVPPSVALEMAPKMSLEMEPEIALEMALKMALEMALKMALEMALEVTLEMALGMAREMAGDGAGDITRRGRPLNQQPTFATSQYLNLG
eukprot:TRINITY_DN491_c0_g1_i1.p2 TRINITY_DN491_c0_g1~~TRINITY_DN491_c0_g1_i1.p2  ORF type:complete len:116 (-),score=29.92 TRINITY_DN491_c0_g1_i1:108-455(-)